MNRIAAVLVTLLFASSAFAYVPPSAFMVKTMTAKRMGYKGFRIRAVVTPADPAKAGRFKELAVVDLVNQAVRSWAYDDMGKLLYAAERKLGQKGEGGAALSTSVLVSADPIVLSRDLVIAGIPVKTEEELALLKDENERLAAETNWLGRLKDNLAWVIAPQEKARVQPSLWILKDSFLPIRLVYPSQDVYYDVRFDNYRFYKEFPFPKTITVQKGEEQLLKAEIGDVTVNPDMAEFRQKFFPGYSDAGNAADGATRDLLRLYYQVVR
jgi:hypothetical protein